MRGRRASGREGEFARLRPGGDFVEQPSGAHAAQVTRGDGNIGHQALQHPVEAVELGRARAPRQSDDRLAGDLAQQDQVAGIDRHAELQDLAAAALDRRRDDVAPVDDGRAAHHQHDTGAVGERALDDLAQRGRIVRRAQVDGIAAAHRRQPAVGDGDGLVEQRRLHRGKLGLDQRDLARPERVEGKNGLLARDRHAGIERSALDRERNDLDGRRHLVRLHRGIVRQGRKGDRLVHLVDGIDLHGIDAQDAALAGIEVDASGERRLDAQFFDAQQRTERCRSGILADIVRLKPRDCDHAAAALLYCFDVGDAQDPAFLEGDLAVAQRVGEDSAGALFDGELGEDHRVGWPWRAAVSCARTEMAISAGDLAPMARPAGPWMRASAVLSNPASDKRCRRAACVFLLPSDPI